MKRALMIVQGGVSIRDRTAIVEHAAVAQAEPEAPAFTDFVVMHGQYLGREKGKAGECRHQAMPMADAGIVQGHIHEENDGAVAVCRHAPPLARKSDLSSIADTGGRAGVSPQAGPQKATASRGDPLAAIPHGREETRYFASKFEIHDTGLFRVGFVIGVTFAAVATAPYAGADIAC